jgi:hypothetical protein
MGNGGKEEMSVLETESIQRRLYCELQIPFPSEPTPGEITASRKGPPFVSASPALIEKLNRLRSEVKEVGMQASRIGVMPPNYPLYATLVMRLVSALLPWYTRPIREFGERAARTACQTLDILEEIVSQQRRFSAEMVRRDALAAKADRGDYEVTGVSSV